MEYGLGWKKQPIDDRDKKYTFSLKSFKSKVDLRCYCSEVYNQLDIGSCTANAVSGAIEFIQKRNKIVPIIKPSRLFIYYNSRKLEGTENEDSGAYIRDVFKVVNNNGFCSESVYPYDTSKFKEKPSLDIFRLAQLKNIQYHLLDQNINALLHCLSSAKPIVFGFDVYSNIDSTKTKTTGFLDIPNKTIDIFIGGHAVLIVGYNLIDKYFIVRNSWGNNWGDKGYFYIPFDYVLNPELSSDFWTVDYID